MDRMTVDGVELAEARFNRMSREMIRKVIEAGAGAAEKRMAENTQRARHVRNGDLLKSIGNNGIRESLNGASTEVYPQGEDRFGQRYATKAYVINYGIGKRPYTKRPKTHPKKNLTGDKFITGDEKQAEEAVLQAMQAESDRLLAEIDND